MQVLVQFKLFPYHHMIYNIITVTSSEVPDHVKLTGTDHQIKQDTERGV